MDISNTDNLGCFPSGLSASIPAPPLIQLLEQQWVYLWVYILLTPFPVGIQFSLQTLLQALVLFTMIADQWFFQVHLILFQDTRPRQSQLVSHVCQLKPGTVFQETLPASELFVLQAHFQSVQTLEAADPASVDSWLDLVCVLPVTWLGLPSPVVSLVHRVLSVSPRDFCLTHPQHLPRYKKSPSHHHHHWRTPGEDKPVREIILQRGVFWFSLIHHVGREIILRRKYKIGDVNLESWSSQEGGTNIL